jgi:hypothetical protein
MVPLLAGCGLSADKQAEAKAKEAVTGRLRDAESARFESLYVSTVTSKEGSRVKAVCGEVNAKNGMGGYVGFRPFIYVIERAKAGGHLSSSDLWVPGEVKIAEGSDSDVAYEIGRMMPLCEDGAVVKDDEINDFPH